jgi:hypothetical protein
MYVPCNAINAIHYYYYFLFGENLLLKQILSTSVLSDITSKFRIVAMFVTVHNIYVYNL